MLSCVWQLKDGSRLRVPVGSLLLTYHLLQGHGSNELTETSISSSVLAVVGHDIRLLLLLLDLMARSDAGVPQNQAEFSQRIEQVAAGIARQIREQLNGPIETTDAAYDLSVKHCRKRRWIWKRFRKRLFAGATEKSVRRLVKSLVSKSLLRELSRTEMTSPLLFTAGWIVDRKAEVLGTDSVNQKAVDSPNPQIEVAAEPQSLDERQEFAAELHRQKLLALRGFAYGASHEINNPLANIALRAESLARTEEDAARRQKLWVIHQQALRAHQMISDLMLFARPPRSEPAAVDLAELVQEIVGEQRRECAEAEIEIVVTVRARPERIQVDPRQVSELLKALLSNAIQSIGRRGQITVAVDATQTGSATITVTDSGKGIEKEILGQIFDPFFSGREAGRGLGFGLSKAWRIAQEHGGDLICVTGAPGATCFRATFRDLRELPARVA